MTETIEPRKMSEHALTLYKAMFESISFLKRQQWAVANYSALIYGAIFWFSHKVPQTLCLSGALSALAILVALISVSLIGKFQIDLAEARRRMLEVEKVYFDSAEIAAFEISNRGHYRGLDVMAALMSVSLVGAALTVLSMFLSPPS